MPHPLAHAFGQLGRRPDARTDAELLAAFRAHADAEAFQAVVRRHGPLVLGTCRRFLGMTPDAEDAFQATFLVLVRRARDIDWRESVGPWLYAVAVRVAKKARANRHRRGRVEQQATTMTADPGQMPSEPNDLAAVLDEELAMLPEKYRRALILCELQGLSRKAAAEALTLSEGTLSSRLARGRQMLRRRLIRRGVTATAVTVAVVPEPLVAATMHGVAGVVPTAVMALTEGVVKSMFVTTKLKLAAVLVAAGLGLTGIGVWSGGGPAATATAEEPKAATVKPAPPPPGAAARPVQLPTLLFPQKPDDPVATIFGDEKITKEQFADYLMVRHGRQEFERFVDVTILRRAFGPNGWPLQVAPLNAALAADAKALGMTPGEYLQALGKLGHSHEEIVNDFATPRAMLAELTGGALLTASVEELRAAFAEKHGEYRTYRHVVAPTEAEARAFHARTKASADAFVTETIELVGAPAKAVLPPLRMPTTRTGSHSPAEVALHKLVTALKPGEIGDPVRGADGTWTVAQCVEIVAGDADKTFDGEKVALYWYVMGQKLHAEVAKVRSGTRLAAPQYHAFPKPATAQPMLGRKLRFEAVPK